MSPGPEAPSGRPGPSLGARLQRLASLSGTDEGFFVLALHSFVERYAHEADPLLRYEEHFDELVWKLGEILKNRRNLPHETIKPLVRWEKFHGTEAEQADLGFRALPRYWVAAPELEARLEGRWERGWLLGWRDITNTTNERTVIASVLPRVGTDFTLRIGFPTGQPALIACLLGNLNAIVLDYVARQKLGGTHLSDYVTCQLPVLPPETYAQPCLWDASLSIRDWLLPRVLELVYTANDLEPFVRDCGYPGSSFPWDPERRFALRCELDAAFFHLYGIARADVGYIMDTFPIVKRHDEQRFGEYRTKRVVLESFDNMAGQS